LVTSRIFFEPSIIILEGNVLITARLPAVAAEADYWRTSEPPTGAEHPAPAAR